MSKFEMIHFAKIINDYFAKNDFRFYANILRFNDSIVDDFLNNLGLELKLEMLLE